MKSHVVSCLIALGLIVPLHADDKIPYNNDVKVQTLLKTSTNSVGQTIEYPHDGPAEVSMLIVTIPPGKQTGWHRHPVPLFGYVLEGQVTVRLANGDKHTFHQGDPLAESVNMLHNGTNEGKETTRLLIVVAGEKGVPFTKKVAVDDKDHPPGDYEGGHHGKSDSHPTDPLVTPPSSYPSP